MKCKKCKKEIPDNALYCQWCGAAQKRNPKKKMYQRPDGFFETTKTINGKKVHFYGKTEKEVTDKMIAYQEEEEAGPLFKVVAEDWRDYAYEEVEYNTAKGYEAKYKRAVEYFRGRKTHLVKSLRQMSGLMSSTCLLVGMPLRRFLTTCPCCVLYWILRLQEILLESTRQAVSQCPRDCPEAAVKCQATLTLN